MSRYERKQWTQEQRKANMEEVRLLLIEYGGYSKIQLRGNMKGFERLVSLRIGCSIRAAVDYIDTLRGASMFIQIAREEKEKEKAKNE